VFGVLDNDLKAIKLWRRPLCHIQQLMRRIYLTFLESP
jgi:hypothetical protein